MLVVAVLVTLSQSLLGGKVYASADNILTWPPFSVEHPAGWVRPSNPILTDPVIGFIPDLMLTRSDLEHGVLPLWSQYAGAGHPLLAAQVHAPLFPITWLAFIISFWHSLAWIAAARLLLTALGAYLLCRELQLRRGPSLVAGLAFPFCSYYFVWLEHPQTNVWALLPWMLLAARRVCTRGSIGAAALLGLASGLSWLGGHPESAALLLGTTAVYGAYLLIAEHQWGPAPGSTDAAVMPVSSLGGRAGMLVAGFALGLGVSAVVNAPLLELLNTAGTTQRGQPPLPRNAVWTFFFPQLWGSPNDLFNGGGPSNYNERVAYIGALPLLLAFGSLGRRRPREQWFFVVLAVVCFITAFDTPLFSAGVRDLPGGMTVGLDRVIIILSLCGAVLAAYGLQRWLEGSARERRRMLIGMSVIAAVPALFWLVKHHGVLSNLGPALGQLPVIHYRETSASVVELASVWRWVLICALGLGGLAVSGWRSQLAVGGRGPGSLGSGGRGPSRFGSSRLGLRGRDAWARAGVALIVVLTAIDLISLDRGYHGSVPLNEANPPVPTSIRYLQAHQGDARVLGSEGAMAPNLAQRYGLRDARIAVDIPYPLRYKQLWAGLGGIGGDDDIYVANSYYGQQLANIFAVRYVMLTVGEPIPHWLQPVLRTSGGIVAVNPTALPRAWVAYDWRPSKDRTTALSSTLASSTTQLAREPVIEGVAAPHAGAGAAAPAITPARMLDDGSETVTVAVNARRPGYLVLDDAAYPGWTATVNGHTVPWHPANEDFRAVRIPTGHDVVSFHYRPSSVYLGAIITLLSLLALLALAVVGVVWSRRRGHSGLSEVARGRRFPARVDETV